jgi:hypothetical protein
MHAMHGEEQQQKYRKTPRFYRVLRPIIITASSAQLAASNLAKPENLKT